MVAVLTLINIENKLKKLMKKVKKLVKEKGKLTKKDRNKKFRKIISRMSGIMFSKKINFYLSKKPKKKNNKIMKGRLLLSKSKKFKMTLKDTL